MLWYAGDEYEIWYAGLASELGEPRGQLCVEGNEIVPWECACDWDVSHGCSIDWEPALSLRCGITHEDGLAAKALDEEAMIEKTKEGAKVALWCKHISEMGYHAYFLGRYTRDQYEINHRPAYRKSDNEHISLWYDGRCWLAGLTTNVGSDMGAIAAQDDAMVPDKVAVSWQVSDEYGWRFADSLSCSTIRVTNDDRKITRAARRAVHA